MSISLNNHASRIKALENAGIFYSEKNLWSGNVYWVSGAGPLTLTDSLSNFDLLYVRGFFSNGMWYRTVPVSELVKPAQEGTYRALLHDPNISWIPFTTNDFKILSHPNISIDTPVTILDITGVKFTKVILYNFSYIIKSAQKFTPLSYLFNKEV